MQFNQLESFVCSAKFLSFSRAAEELYISQPSVSLHVLNLENEFGVKLFNRENKNLVLSPYGEFFLPLAKEMLYLRDVSKEKLNDYAEKREGSIHLLTSSIPASHILPDILNKYLEEAPKTNFKILTYDSKQVCSELLEGRASVGIVGSKYHVDTIAFDKLVDDEIIFVSSEDLGEIGILDLLKYNIISREAGSGTRNAVENELEKLGLDLDKQKSSVVVEDSFAIISLVKKGRGITYLSRRMAEEYIDRGTLFEVKVRDFKVMRSFYFAYVKDRMLTHTEEGFKKFVIRYFG